MPRAKKPTDHLDAVKHLMGAMADHEIAVLANSTPSIVGRYRRRLGIPAYEGYKFGMGQEPPSRKADDAPEPPPEEPKAVEAPATKGRSKLDAFIDVIGKLPDAEVAAMANVTAEGVRIYRRRHHIPLAATAKGGRGAKAAATEAAPKATATAKAAAAKTTKGKGKGKAAPAEAPAPAPEIAPAPVAAPVESADSKKPLRRASKLDPFADFIGTLPDKEVAAMAGVTPENVRAFRRRHDIPARWRDESDEDAVVAAAETTPAENPGVVPAAALSEAPAVEAKELDKATPILSKAEAPVAPRKELDKATPVLYKTEPAVETSPARLLNGYMVSVTAGDLKLDYIIVSSDIAAAAAAAVKAVAGQHGSSEITSIKHLGPALA